MGGIFISYFYVKIGEKITVKVTGIDNQGKINLTMKGLNGNKSEIKIDSDEEVSDDNFEGSEPMNEEIKENQIEE